MYFIGCSQNNFCEQNAHHKCSCDNCTDGQPINFLIMSRFGICCNVVPCYTRRALVCLGEKEREREREKKSGNLYDYHNITKTKQKLDAYHPTALREPVTKPPIRETDTHSLQ